MTTGRVGSVTDGNEWVYVRVWLGLTAVEHYRADRETAERFADHMRAHLPNLRCTIDPMPAFAPHPMREISAWRLHLPAP